MPAVFVHGVPDTHRVWAEVIGHLDRADVVAPDLPGFGTPAPDGFVPTKEGYLEVELVEPALRLGLAPATATTRFAQAIVATLG